MEMPRRQTLFGMWFWPRLIRKHARYIIERVLDFGNDQEVR